MTANLMKSKTTYTAALSFYTATTLTEAWPSSKAITLQYTVPLMLLSQLESLLFSVKGKDISIDSIVLLACVKEVSKTIKQNRMQVGSV